MSEQAGARAPLAAVSGESSAGEDYSGDAALWRDLVGAGAADVEAFFNAWLAIVARSFSVIVRAEVWLDTTGAGALQPVARWAVRLGPAEAGELGRDAKPVIEAVLKSRQPAIEAAGTSGAPIFAGFPFLVDSVLHGVVVVESSVVQGASGRRLVRHLQWASAWVEAYLRRRAVDTATEAGRRATALIDVINATVSAPHFHDACHALAAKMAQVFNCGRVSIGWRHGQTTRIAALLQTATFERKYDAGRQIETAMDEAIDQLTVLTAPASPDAPYVAIAQETLARAVGANSVVSVPMARGEMGVGAVTLERFDGARFGQDEIALCDALCAAAGPILADKWEKDLGLPVLMLRRLRAFGATIIGPGHLGLKAALTLLLGAVIFFTVATGPYRISARAQMQGEVRRVLSAPFDGYIRAQSHRAGQIVAENAILAELQGNDLTLDRLRHVAQRRQYQLELDRALSKRDLALANITRAQIEQKDAEIELADQMLARTQIRAPFAGVIVNGDLSQSVGRPVARGDTLFELAPLDQYRVTLVVPEFDLQSVRPGQRGQVLLAALPERSFNFEVNNITPVAHVQDGVNGFEVHSVLLESDPRIRPGMEGLAKLDAGERKLVAIWTHGLLHWARIKLWAWIP